MSSLLTYISTYLATPFDQSLVLLPPPRLKHCCLRLITNLMNFVTFCGKAIEYMLVRHENIINTSIMLKAIVPLSSRYGPPRPPIAQQYHSLRCPPTPLISNYMRIIVVIQFSSFWRSYFRGICAYTFLFVLFKNTNESLPPCII